MKDSLRAGTEHELGFVVPGPRTLPNLYPASEEFGALPEVFAAGFFVGLVEWACVQATDPHLGWPREQTPGTRVDLPQRSYRSPSRRIWS